MRIVELPFVTVSVLNKREHWGARARRAASERAAARMLFKPIVRDLGPKLLPCTITLTRCGKRALDTDNLAASFKAVRDGIADAMKLKDDSDPRVSWKYAQHKGDGVTVVEWIAQ